MPQISVIVPTRKRNHLLPRALKSLFCQTFQDFEIVIVDDNPPGERIRVDRSLSDLLRNSKVRIVENKSSRNAARARNAGLSVATGNWVTYLDDDDAYFPEKLAKQLDFANATGLPVGLCGMKYRLRGRSREKQIDSNVYAGDDLLLRALSDTKAIFHRRCDVRFNEELSAAEDAYFFFALTSHFNVRRVFNVPEALVEVFDHSGPRVNRNAEALWQGNSAILRDFSHAFSSRACHLYFLRSRLYYHKFHPGEFNKLLPLSLKMLWASRGKEARTIMNVLAFKIPWLKPFVV